MQRYKELLNLIPELQDMVEEGSKQSLRISQILIIIAGVNKYDEEEKAVKSIHTLGGSQEAWFLTEE